jgi:hypothetical protein
MMRRCGECTLCCRLLPMHAGQEEKTPHACAAMVTAGIAKRGIPAFEKPAGEKCPHERHTGCAVYAIRPIACQVWSCRWLVNDDTGDLRRPDRSGYVLDVMPDYVTLRMDDSGEETNIQVVQIWIDTRRGDDWRLDASLRAYLERRGKEGIAALIRFNARDGLVLFPPSMSADGQWHERRGDQPVERSAEETYEGLMKI